MADPTYLYARGARYWWRRSVPRELQAVLRTRELRRSTGSSTLRAARAAARRLNAAADAAFGEIFDRMDTLTPDQARALVGRAIDIFADCGQLSRLADRAGRSGRREAWEVGRDACALELGAGWLREAMVANDRDGLELAEAVLEDAAEELGLGLPADGTVAREELLEGAARGMIQLYGRLADEARGVFADDAAGLPPALPPWGAPPVAAPAAPPPDAARPAAAPAAVALSAVPAPAAPTPGPDAAAPQADGPRQTCKADLRFAEAFDLFVRERCPHEGEPHRDRDKNTKWTTERASGARVSMRLFLDLLGDKPVREVTDAAAEAFRNRLARVPVRWGRPEFDKLAPGQAAAEADRLEAARLAALEERRRRGELAGEDYERAAQDARVERLSAKTQNKHVDTVAGLFKELHEKGRLPYNPFKGVRHTKSKAANAARGEREGWEDFEVRRLLTHASMRAAPDANLAAAKRPAAGGGDPAVFWLAVLIAYMGLRPEEAMQLEAGDFVTVFGVPCLRVRGTDGRRVKSEAGWRCLPLHRVLVELGLPERVEAVRRRGGRRLFPELSTRAGAARKEGSAN